MQELRCISSLHDPTSGLPKRSAAGSAAADKLQGYIQTFPPVQRHVGYFQHPFPASMNFLVARERRIGCQKAWVLVLTAIN